MAQQLSGTGADIQQANRTNPGPDLFPCDSWKASKGIEEEERIGSEFLTQLGHVCVLPYFNVKEPSNARVITGQTEDLLGSLMTMHLDIFEVLQRSLFLNNYTKKVYQFSEQGDYEVYSRSWKWVDAGKTLTTKLEKTGAVNSEPMSFEISQERHRT